MSDILSLPADSFAPKQVTYIDALDLLPLYDGLAFRAPAIVCGPKGVGKTLSIQHYANKVRSPIITFDCSEDVRRSHLLGMHIIRGGSTPFVLGPITNAFEVANEVGRCILCLEEINCIHPSSNVMLPSGLQVPIERVQVGDAVVSFGPSGQQGIETVVEVRDEWANTSFTLDCGERRITASGNHLFWTARGWSYAEDIREGDRILHLQNLRLREEGPAGLKSSRTYGARRQSGTSPGRPSKGEDAGGSRKTLQGYARKVEGQRVPRGHVSLPEKFAPARGPNHAGKDGCYQKATDEERVGRRGEAGQTFGSLSVPRVPRGCSTRWPSHRSVLAESQRSRLGLGTRSENMVRPRTQAEYVGEAEGVPEGAPRGQDTVCTCGVECGASHSTGAEGYEHPRRSSGSLCRRRQQMVDDPRWEAPQSRLHCQGKEGTAGRWGLLAPERAARGRDGSLHQHGLYSVETIGRGSEKPRPNTSGGEDVPRWVTVQRVVVNRTPTPLREIGLTGTHTYFANGLGTHNSLSPQSQKILNAVADWRCRVEVPEAQKVFKLQPGKELWVTGTMNTAVYGGVYALNEDLKSRFRVISVDYPNPTSEKKILDAVLNGGVRKEVVKQVMTLAHETRQASLDYALSPRDVVQLLEDIAALDLTRALRIVVGKFEGTDKATVRERITSIFKVDLNGKKR